MKHSHSGKTSETVKPQIFIIAPMLVASCPLRSYSTALSRLSTTPLTTLLVSRSLFRQILRPQRSPQSTMSRKITPVTSLTQFNTILSQSTYTIVDFYADWCGPCKTIAPIFASLAEKEARPGKVQFCKVDVDGAQDVARKFGVSA